MKMTYRSCSLCGLRITEKHSDMFYNLYEHPHCKSKLRNRIAKNHRRRESNINKRYPK